MNNSISAIADIVSPPPAAPEAKSPDNLGKEEFLKLLIAQIQKQDPLNPQDPAEFTAQLTQFSSLEQLMSVNQGLNALGAVQVASTRLAAVSTIGRLATVSGERLSVNGGQATPVNFKLDRDAASTVLRVRNEAGREVATMDLGPRAAGQQTFQWNGLDAQGNPVADGNYTFSIEAQDGAGNALDTTSTFTGIVTGITFENGTTLLKINGGNYSMDEVIGLESAA